MKYSYTEEKLMIAVYRLAAGEGDVRSRLVDAHLSFHVLSIEDFPNHLQSDWNSIIQSLTQKGPRLNYRNEIILSSVANTMSSVKNRTAARIAEKIINVYFELVYHCGKD